MLDLDLDGLKNVNDSTGDDDLRLLRFTEILDEIADQPVWRGQADREADYIDGNQLDSQSLKDMEMKGISPSIENLIGLEVSTAHGRAASNKKDAKVIPQEGGEGEEVAEGLNAKLHIAEKTSNADKACLLAHDRQIGVGIGWCEVSRGSDPFKAPYRVKEVGRNEIWWDMTATEPDLSDAMWLLRRRWTSIQVAMLKFPEHSDLIFNAGTGWNSYDFTTELNDGGTETGLYQSRDIERGWSIEDQEWRDIERERVCIFEVLERRYREVLVLKSGDGRVLEFDREDPIHVQAIVSGFNLEKAIVSDIYKSFFIGPHHLETELVEGSQGVFNYVNFFYHVEDRTGVPYGMVRGMIPLQDEHNARVSSMVWGLGSVRTTRTEGAVLMTDNQLREVVARRDADIVLDHKLMRNGGIFKVERDYQLTSQQYERMQDIRSGIKRQSLMSDSFRGGGGDRSDSASGMQLEVDQSMQATSTLQEQYEYSRTRVMDMLLWMVIEDSDGEEDVFIKGSVAKEDHTVTLNRPMIDLDSGARYLDNDVHRTRVKVALSEVPENPSLAQQELMSLTEFAKSSIPEIQAVLAPYIANLANIPDKEEIVEAIKQAIATPSEEVIEKRISDAVDEEKNNMQYELKSRELDMKAEKNDADIQKIVAEAVNASLTAFYSATQAAAQIVQAPQLAPIADQLMGSAGFEDQDAGPVIPGIPAVDGMGPNANFPIQGVPDPVVMGEFENAAAASGVTPNTSPGFPPRVQQPALPGPGGPESLKAPGGPGAGVGTGIETPGAVSVPVEGPMV